MCLRAYKNIITRVSLSECFLTNKISYLEPYRGFTDRLFEVSCQSHRHARRSRILASCGRVSRLLRVIDALVGALCTFAKPSSEQFRSLGAIASRLEPSGIGTTTPFPSPPPPMMIGDNRRAGLQKRGIAGRPIEPDPRAAVKVKNRIMMSRTVRV